MNKYMPRPSKGQGNLQVGDLVYWGFKASDRRGIVTRIHKGAAVVYSYKTKREQLFRLFNLRKVED
jgi:hypothetical protein